VCHSWSSASMPDCIVSYPRIESRLSNLCWSHQQMLYTALGAALQTLTAVPRLTQLFTSVVW